MKNITKKITRISTVLTASILSAALPLTALAAQNSPDDNTYQPKDVQTVDYKKSLTPEFAYSAEKWATLRDNIMEYITLIRRLIHFACRNHTFDLIPPILIIRQQHTGRILIAICKIGLRKDIVQFLIGFYQKHCIICRRFHSSRNTVH